MTCDDAHRQLTAYLDGDLVDTRGSAMRGHLRECAACRDIAATEAQLRDGLRTLPPVDPPPSLWAGVQAQLAAAEVDDARRPAWRRWVSRGASLLAPAMPRARDLAFGGVAIAAAVTFVIWRANGRDGEAVPRATPAVDVAHQAAEFGAAGSQASVPPVLVVSSDVTSDLADEPTQISSTYSQAAEELLVLATEARARWTPDQQTSFDTRLQEIKGQIAMADGRSRIHAERALVRFLQNAAVRDEVTLAGGAQ